MESRIVVKRIAFRAGGGGARRSVPGGFRNFSITSVIFNATEFVPDRWRRSNLAGQKPVVRKRQEGVDSGGHPRGITTPTCNAFSLDRTNTNFAAGAGAQFKIGSCAVRAEYERFEADGANPSLWSVGVTWTFR
jgi:hypothetical protein